MEPPEIKYQQVVDATPALIFSARPDGYIDYFNQRWRDTLGVPLHELAGWAWARLIHPDDLARHVQTWREAMASGEPAISQARVRHANGEYRWMQHRTEALRDEEGNVVRWFGSSIDIEELKRAQHELHKLKDRLHKENIGKRLGTAP